MCVAAANIVEEHLQHLAGCIGLLKLHSPHFPTLHLDEYSTTDFLQNGHRTIGALLSKGFRATSVTVRSNASKRRQQFRLFPRIACRSTKASGWEVWTV
jgi:hypothetical protein